MSRLTLALLLADASLAAVKTAREAGVPTMVDAGTLREGMLALIPFTDYFIASERFAHAFQYRRSVMLCVVSSSPIPAMWQVAHVGPR